MVKGHERLLCPHSLFKSVKLFMGDGCEVSGGDMEGDFGLSSHC